MSGRPRAAHTLGQTQGTVTHPQLGNMWPAGLLNRCFIWNCGLIAVVGGRFILQLMFYLVDSIVKLINVLLRSFSICEGGGVHRTCIVSTVTQHICPHQLKWPFSSRSIFFEKNLISRFVSSLVDKYFNFFPVYILQS